MRNGLNISSVSELVHEISNEPREARIRFATRVRRTASGNGRAHVGTAQAGTIRIPPLRTSKRASTGSRSTVAPSFSK